MTETFTDEKTSQDLMHTAVHCYLSAILSTTACIAKVFPSAGIPYQNRWRRLPQRIGFELTPRSLEASGRMFDSDLDRFAELASRLLGEGINMVHKVGSEGAKPFEAAVQETVSCAGLLDELAQSLEESADLDATPEIADMLVLQSEGLRKFSRELRNRLLPELNNLTTIIRECRKVLVQAEQDAILDPSTGFMNNRGFRYELKSRYDESHECCVLLIDCTATLGNGEECEDEDFDRAVGDLAARLGDQFRPWDCLGRIGPRRLAVIFEGNHAVARDRSEQIARSISGTYSDGIAIAATIRVMEVLDADSLLTVLATLGKVPAAKSELIPVLS